MYTSLEDEMRAVLDTMKRQNKEIRRLILKEDGMKVIRCTGNLTSESLTKEVNNHQDYINYGLIRNFIAKTCISD